uniref:Transcription initiation factor TFIID subunit 10 isoform X1 n=1 Tax=Rhizophora mucronata TaxID=61149 RepID=A0A2P2LWF1_RHIMU
MSDCRIRLVAVATQKFVAEVATDALQYVYMFFSLLFPPIFFLFMCGAQGRLGWGFLNDFMVKPCSWKAMDCWLKIMGFMCLLSMSVKICQNICSFVQEDCSWELNLAIAV